jgi:outer membrane lipoprotein SlyB
VIAYHPGWIAGSCHGGGNDFGATQAEGVGVEIRWDGKRGTVQVWKNDNSLASTLPLKPREVKSMARMNHVIMIALFDCNRNISREM